MIGYQRFPPVTRVSITACPDRLHHRHISRYQRYIIGTRGISQVSQAYILAIRCYQKYQSYIIGIRCISQVSEVYYRYTLYERCKKKFNQHRCKIGPSKICTNIIIACLCLTAIRLTCSEEAFFAHIIFHIALV